MDLAARIKDVAESTLKELSELPEEASPETTETDREVTEADSEATKSDSEATKSASEGHFIVDVLFFERQRPSKVMVIVDGDHGVTIDVCARLSKKLGVVLEEQNVLNHAYVLEVTTPGVDQPLKMKRQYFKNAGRQFKVHLKDKTIVQGKLEEVTEDKLTIRQTVDKKETKLTEVTFDQIEKAYVMVSFK